VNNGNEYRQQGNLSAPVGVENQTAASAGAPVGLRVNV